MNRNWYMIALGFGCAPEPAQNDCGESGATLHYVVTSMGYMRSEDGISLGYDIDGTDDPVCRVDDLTDPEGGSGIDNGLSYLIPALQASEAKVVEGYINEAIIEGRVLLAVEIQGVDSLVDDDCVDVTFLQAEGEPLLGTDGGLLAGQTLLRADLPESTVRSVQIVNGVLDARPLNLDVPVSLLDANFELNMRDGGLQLRFAEDGAAEGFFTGGLHQEEITEILNSSGGVDSDVADLVNSILGLGLDLEDENGQCAKMSAGLEFQAAAIYLVGGGVE